MSVEKQSGPVPFKLNTLDTSSLGSPLNRVQSVDQNEVGLLFPTTRSVLWNRAAIGDEITVNPFANDRKIKFIINQRTLHLAFKQLKVLNEDFHGFFIGDMHWEVLSLFTGAAPKGLRLVSALHDILSIHVDRFDPGRDAKIQSEIESGIKTTRLPTTTIPGDMVLPIWFHDGMAFVDHKTTQTHTVDDFFKGFKVLESWCSRKDKLDPKKYVSSKINCCFQENDEDILAYITCGCIFISSEIMLKPINTIPIIQTALARNLLGPNSLNELQRQVKTGYITMDQTRKLLLLLETDPKSFDLPLVGIWMSGLDNVQCPEIWSACVRFIFNRLIHDRVYAPPQNYLLVVYSVNASNAQFFEFSKTVKSDDLNFHFLSSCEGIQLNKTQKDPEIDGYVFDLVSQTSGLLLENFNQALTSFNRQCDDSITCDKDENIRKFVPNVLTTTLDDSLPYCTPSPQPHPHHIQMSKKIPMVPDLSICESFIIENDGTHAQHTKHEQNKNNRQSREEANSSLNTLEGFNIKVKKTSPVKKSKILPRQTKASIARMNLNKPEKDTLKPKKKKTLAINFSKNTLKQTAIQKKCDEKNASKTIVSLQNNIFTDIIPQKHDDEDENLIPRLPVQIRDHDVHLLKPHYMDWCKNDERSVDDSVDFHTTNQSYHPENYSDMQDEESFLMENVIHRSEENFVTGNEKKTNSYALSSPQTTDDKGPLSSDDANGMEGKLVDENTMPPKKSPSHTRENEEIKENTFISRSDLCNVLETQQKQLAELQAQLKVFMDHQNQSKEMEEKELAKMNTDDLLKKELEDQEVLSMQRKQQNQLNELQDQLQLFLKLTMEAKEETRKKVDTSIQCTPTQSMMITPSKVLEPQSIGTNTGESLLWPGVDMTTTNSDTTPRGMQQASGIMESKSTGAKKNMCSCCHHCHKPTKSLNRRRSDPDCINDSLKNNASFQSANLSEIHTDDINGSIFNDTASSTRTLASSIKAVDIPVFDDSQESPEKKEKINNMLDWNTTPLLGESASMLIEQRKKENKEIVANLKNEEETEEQFPDVDENIFNNKEFYNQMMVQVQKMISAHDNSETDATDSIDPALPETLDDFRHLLTKSNTALTQEEQAENIRDTTIKKLQEVIQDPELSPPKDYDLRNRSYSTSILPTFPRLNYASMATDDTYFNSSQHFNDIAAKYLPKEFLVSEKKEVRNKTVKFEGVYELQGGLVTNTTSVNFSCNMSIASRKYLQKYDLAELEKTMMLTSQQQPLVDRNGRCNSQQKNQREDNIVNNKENILDFTKLKKLSKLT